jgi:hypothetical protein
MMVAVLVLPVTVTSMPTTYIWHLWPGRHWPLLQSEEAQFVADLTQRAGTRRTAFDRGNLTAVLNSLRCGLSVDELFNVAPGLDPAGLLVAYQWVDTLRATSADAWKAIVAAPTLATVTTHGHEAAKLLPVPVRRMMATAEHVNAELLAAAAREAALRIAHTTTRAMLIESKLAHHTPPSPPAVDLGRLLYDPYEPQLWGDPYFLPDRVGSLMPLRVADLLGEARR